MRNVVIFQHVSKTHNAQVLFPEYILRMLTALLLCSQYMLDTLAEECGERFRHLVIHLSMAPEKIEVGVYHTNFNAISQSKC